MSLLSQFLVLGVAIVLLAVAIVLFVVLAVWIWSLKSNRSVRPPLVESQPPNRPVWSLPEDRVRAASTNLRAIAATNHK